MPKLKTLWVDMLASIKEGDLPSGFRGRCETVYCSDVEQAAALLTRRPVDLVCFDFDYPDRTGLRAVLELKNSFPSLPILMLTVQHSESLAIWAFRNRIWDYLVKPIAEHDAEHCLAALADAIQHRRRQPARPIAAHSEKIPDEVAYTPKSEGHSLAAAIYYVEQNFQARVRSEQVAALCGLSTAKFSRLFKETYGVTFRDYLVNYRLKEACRLLENPTVAVADVAFAVGFQDPSYFARIFKERLGTTPSGMIGQATLEPTMSESDVAAPTIERAH